MTQQQVSTLVPCAFVNTLVQSQRTTDIDGVRTAPSESLMARETTPHKPTCLVPLSEQADFFCLTAPLVEQNPRHRLTKEQAAATHVPAAFPRQTISR